MDRHAQLRAIRGAEDVSGRRIRVQTNPEPRMKKFKSSPPGVSATSLVVVIRATRLDSSLWLLVRCRQAVFVL